MKRWKSCLIVLVFIALTVFGMQTVFADESGKCGENLTWTLDDAGTLTISGTGEMWNYDCYYEQNWPRSPWFHSRNSITNVCIESGVTSVGDGVFYKCGSIKNIIISEDVKRIGEWAFYECDNLTSVTIPQKVTDIGAWAFYSCSGLTNITIPNSVTSIGAYAFSGCGLTNITIPNSVTSIHEGTFQVCRRLTSIIIPTSVTSIGTYAFHSCDSLASITIPNSVTSIGSYVFLFCPMLTSITIPSSVTSIGKHPFEKTWIKDIYYGGSEEDWNKAYSDGDLEGVTIHYNSNNSENTGNNNVKEIIDDAAINGNSSTYYPKLSYQMMQVASAAYNDNGNDSQTLYKKLGFSPSQYKEYDFKEKTINKKGYMIGTKEVDGKPVILIAIRGTYGNDFNVEWQSNIMGALPGLDKRAEHTAFSTWAGEIFDTIHENYWSQKAKYFITGHSRGAGAANLLTKRLIDNGLSKQNIFNYNFACPDVAVDYPWNWMSSNKYSNIFNIGYATDPVTYLPGSIGNVVGATGTVMSAFFDPRAMVDGTGISWGKYGNSVWFSNNWNDPNDAYPPVSDKISEGHLQNNYLSFLEKLPSYNAAKSYLEVVTNRSRVAISSLIAQIFGFYCPVDVMIKNSKGTPVASVIDGKVNYYNSTFGLVIIAVSGDHKVIYINSNEDYTVELTGTDNGTMTFCKGNIDNQTNTVTEDIAFANVKLNKGKKMIANAGGDIKPQEMELYVLNNLGEKTKEIDTKGKETDLQTSENHVLIKVDKKEATCLTDGNIEYWTCETCGKMFSDEAGTQEVTTVAIEKTGHKLQKVDAKAATSSSAGNVEYYECSVCHKKFSDQAATKELQDREIVIPQTGGNSERSEEKTNDPSSGSEEDQNVSSRSNSGTETTVSSNSGTTDNSEAIGTVGSTYNPGIADNQENTSESDSTEKQEAVTTVNDLITIPLTPTGVKVKAIKKGKVIVSWKKIKKSKKTKDLLAQIKRIQIQYSTDPAFKQNPVTKNVSKSKTEVVLKLKKKTTYYIRLRYVGKEGFSNWSKVKKVKMK